MIKVTIALIILGLTIQNYSYRKLTSSQDELIGSQKKLISLQREESVLLYSLNKKLVKKLMAVTSEVQSNVASFQKSKPKKI